MYRYLPHKLLQETPSFKDGIPKEHEKEIRVTAITFLRKLCYGLGFPYYTVATATIYLHYFYTFYSMKKYSYLDVAITCVLVASKVEETYKKIKQILITACKILNPNFQGFDVDTEEFENHRLKVASYERLLLDSIGFDFDCTHPHLYLAKYLKKLHNSQVPKDVTYKSFEILNEFYLTTLCLQYPCFHLLFSVIILVNQNCKLDVKHLLKNEFKNEPFKFLYQEEAKRFSVTIEELEDIYHQWMSVKRLTESKSVKNA